jgi:hypothetical protein
LWFLPGWRVVTSKNHDKQLTHIVRVRFSGPFRKTMCLDPAVCHKFLKSL